MFEPENTLAIVVAVEQYCLPSGWQVPGLCARAIAYVDWLTEDCRVPPGNIRLFLSPVAGCEAKPENPQVEAPRRADQDGLYKYFENDFPDEEGELLIVFWAGHGLYARSEHRLVLCANAKLNALHSVDFDALLGHLEGEAIQQFRQQIFIVDACATLEEELKSGFTASRGFQRRARRPDVRQAVFYSASRGQIAVTSSSGGTFSTYVLSALEESPDWPPNIDDVVDKVKAVYASLRAAGKTAQVPDFVLKGWANSYDPGYPGHSPGAVTRPSRLGALQIDRIVCAAEETRVLYGVPGLGAAITPNAAEQARLQDEGPSALLRRALETDKLEDLLQATEQALDGTVAQSRRQALLRVRNQHGTARLAHDIDQALPTIESSRPALIDSFMYVSADRTLRPDGLLHALEIVLNQRGQDPQGRDPLLEFAAALAANAGHEIPREAMNALPGRARPLNAEQHSDLYTRLRKRIAARKQFRPYVIIDLHGASRTAGDGSWPTKLLAFLCTSEGWQTSEPEATMGTEEGTRRAFRDLVEWARGKVGDDMRVEVVLPRGLFKYVPEEWSIGDGIIEDDPAQLRLSVVLRWGERFWLRDDLAVRKNWRDWAEQARDRLRNDPCIEWLLPMHARDVDAVKSAMGQARHMPWIGLPFGPGEAPRNLSSDPFVAAVAPGTPCLLWLHGDPVDLDACCTSVEKFITAPDPRDELLRENREKLHIEPVRVLWDDPERMPPGDSLEAPRTSARKK